MLLLLLLLLFVFLECLSGIMITIDSESKPSNELDADLDEKSNEFSLFDAMASISILSENFIN